ncbi:MAG: hypothetical protein ACXVNF_04780 [Neobacillus sp.]
MNKELYLKQIFQIVLIENSEEITSNHEFLVNCDEFNINITVSENLKQIEAKTKFVTSDDVHQVIKSQLIANETCDSSALNRLDKAIAEAQKCLIHAVNKLVDLMAFTTGYLYLVDNLRQGNCYCSLDGEHWEDVKKRTPTAFSEISYNTIPSLIEREREVLQVHIDNKVEPFLAIHHLYKAMKETDPRHKLMNLALALELGIKEYLVRKKPDSEIEVLIKNLPSPPLVKLYGEVLECFSGERTPVKPAEIEKITKKRNGLIHTVIKPDEHDISNHDIERYKAATEIALSHLWLDLYPYDERIILRYVSLLKRNNHLLRIDYIYRGN